MPIKHLFVLMMENRSFDHLLGHSGIPGITAPEARWNTTMDAPDSLAADVPHEFDDVKAQIGGTPPMSGFATQSYWPSARAGFGPGRVPVLASLASQYFLFDNWYASMPGPTWPNRFFVHAASAGGLADSPSTGTVTGSTTVDSLSFDFSNGTLFNQIGAGHRWRVYHDDAFPQVLAIKGMVNPFRLNTDHFRWIKWGGSETFRDDLSSGYDVDYTFIEPNYGILSGGFGGSNCQHPTGSIAAGEAFIHYVVESISRSPVWPESLILITYDEHGGFFDHQPPPAATPPGDQDLNSGRSSTKRRFDFKQLGVRVPTVAVSPWIAPGGIGSRHFPGMVFDHAAVARTAFDLFKIPGTLTDRDKSMSSFASICSLTSMRPDLPTLPVTPSAIVRAIAPGSAGTPAAPAAVPPPMPLDGMTAGFQRIALSLDLAMAQDQQRPPVAAAHPAFAPAAAPTMARGPAAASGPAAAPGQTPALVSDYIRRIAREVDANKAGH